MSTVPTPSEDSTQKTSTKARLSDADLAARIAADKRELAARKKREQDKVILRLGQAAYKAGLGNYNLDIMPGEFTRLAERLKRLTSTPDTTPDTTPEGA